MSTSPCGWAAWRAPPTTARRCSRSRSPCAHRGWVTCSSTWRRSPRRRSSRASEDLDLSGLPWPRPGAWVTRLAARRTLVSASDKAELPRSGQPVATRRHAALSRSLLARGARRRHRLALVRRRTPAAGRRRAARRGVRAAVHRRGRAPAGAAACIVLRRLAVLAGGPGTGKTTTVARDRALIWSRRSRPASAHR